MEANSRFAHISTSLIACIILSVTVVLAQEAAQETGGEKVSESGVTTEVSLSRAQNVTLDFKDADIHNVLKIISYKTGVNIVTTPEVMGSVTVRLVDVPWETALDVILKTYGFGYDRVSDKIIMVSSLEKLSQQRKSQQEVAEIEPFDTKTFALNFSKAEDIKNSIEKLISAKGKIALESRTNTLIITDTKSNLIKIGEVLKNLDKITPQVLIEAKIIETSLGSTEKLGIDWTTIAKVSGSKRPTFFPFLDDKINKSTMFPRVQVPSELERIATVTTDPATGIITTSKAEKVWNDLARGFPAVSADQFTFGTLDFSAFQLVLEVLKARSDTKVLSNPRIATLNNNRAEMFVGTIYPIPTYSWDKERGATIISGYVDQKVGIRLVVTPSINEQNYITLDVNPSVDQVIGQTGPNGERPVFGTRSAQTKVMIKDGQTLVIGGLISENRIKSKKGLPILGDLPILNYIFGKKEDTVTKTELLIFITTRIIREGMSSPEEIANLKEKLGQGQKAKPASKKDVK